MSHETPAWRRLTDLCQRIEAALIGSLVLAAIVLFLYGSATRVLAPAYTIDWAEEVTIYLVVWSTLLTGRRLAAERAHISARVLEHLLPAAARRVLAVAIDAMTFAFCAVVLWLGSAAVRFAHSLDERSATTLQVPQAWALYLALPIAMALILLGLVLPSRRD
jgi:TRAP-type C4-dicarboxylate transport system permease small subunit